MGHFVFLVFLLFSQSECLQLHFMSYTPKLFLLFLDVIDIEQKKKSYSFKYGQRHQQQLHFSH